MSIEDRVKRWINPTILSMSAYKVADSIGMIKLDAMENPYTLPDDVLNSYLAELKKADINRYPDPDCEALKPLIRETFEISNDLELLFGNGSDELIQLIVMSVAGSGKTIMAPEPSFVMYQVVAESLGLNFIGCPLKDDFSIDLETTLSLIEKEQPAVIFLAYPNNPTGNCFNTFDIEEIIKSAEGIVVIDEAYQIFSQQSYINSINNYENVLVLRTLSKAGLAGLRFGFLTGNPVWLNEINKIRLPYNINSLTQVSLEFFLKNYHILLKQADQIIAERVKVFDQLSNMPVLKVYPSDANFILFKLLNHSAESVFNSLLENKVLIKKFNPSQPVLAHCLRVSIGKPAENKAFMTYLQQIIN